MTQSLDRRAFLQTAAAGGALLAAGPQTFLLAADKKPMTDLPIIDTHQHLWDLTKFKLPWLTGDEGKALGRSYVTKDYKEAVAGLNVVKTVYMEVDVDPSQQDAEAEYVIDLCAKPAQPLGH